MLVWLLNIAEHFADFNKTFYYEFAVPFGALVNGIPNAQFLTKLSNCIELTITT